MPSGEPKIGLLVQFTMHGAREAVSQGLATIEPQVREIERAVTDNPGLAFDLAKALVEATCKSILHDKKVKYGKTDSLPKLFKLVTQNVSLLSGNHENAKVARKSIEKALAGLNQALQGVCELRNNHGFTSHGKAGAADETVCFDGVQALLAAQAADAIVGFLYRTHRESLAPPPPPPLNYGDNPEFNAVVDERNSPILVWFGAGEDQYSLDYEASRMLFEFDREAYRNALAEFNGAKGSKKANGKPEPV